MCSSPRARGLAGVAHAPARRPRLRDVLSEAPPAEPVAVAVPRPVDEEGLALDLFPPHEPPVPTVLRVVAGFAHPEVGVGGGARRGTTPGITPLSPGPLGGRRPGRA